MAKKAAAAKPKAKAAESKKIKKEPAAASRKQAKKEQVDKGKGKAAGGKLLELGLLCDCTSSMWSWIDRAKKTLIQIIDNVVASCDGKLKVRVCFVGYRDIKDYSQRFSIIDFTDDVNAVRDFISKVQAQGGMDIPEDVAGGFRKCLDQKWTDSSEKQVFHIFDAPCHGKKYHDHHDDFPNGDPTGLVIEDLMKEFHDKGISFTCIKLNNDSDKMMKIMKEHHPELQITDMAAASIGKSAEEVNKLFIDSASVILRDKVGGKDATGAKRTATKKGKPLWDPKKLAVKDIFSNITYLQVKKIDGNMISVQNHYGGSWIISKNLMARDMDSADHFAQEIKCTMTELSTILQACGDHIMKVQFKKKVDAADVEAKLSGYKKADLKKPAIASQLSKQLIEGERCEMVCHLVECDNNLGRSSVIDLNAIPGRNFRQVDHRTIDHIIYKNVKYSLGKRAANQADLELPLKPSKDATSRWDQSKLSVGDWFSQINYYKVKEIIDKETVKVTTSKNKDEEIKMSRDILEYEMNSGTIFETEEKRSRTDIVDLLMNAKQAVFTVKFNKKVDDKHVKEVLDGAKGAKTDFKKMAQELLTGKPCEMTCCLGSSDGYLGRSTVFDLSLPHGMNFRQVDHRTIQELVLKNVKYVVK